MITYLYLQNSCIKSEPASIRIGSITIDETQDVAQNICWAFKNALKVDSKPTSMKVEEVRHCGPRNVNLHTWDT